MQSSAPLFGLLNVNKPAGKTSRRVVDRVAKLVKPAKVGHAGTLDPMATGVLVVCVGAATRLIPRIQQSVKVYRSTFLLGARSDTDDVTGELIETPDPVVPDIDAVHAALAQFQGTIEQIPPDFSAVHVAGRRAYKLARQGKQFELAPKTVEIHSLQLLAYQFPEVELEIACGSGTYIRSLARDLGELLGCGAVMSSLERTRVGPFQLGEAVAFDQLRDDWREAFMSPLAALPDIPRHVCSEAETDPVRHGNPIPAPTDVSWSADQEVALLGPDDELLSIAYFDSELDQLQPKQVFRAY